jgi:hypothetical protein
LYRLPYGRLREKAVPDPQGRAALVLAPEHLLLHLALHAFEELETARILKIMDIHRVMTKAPVDWQFLVGEADCLQVLGPAAWILSRVGEVDPQALPPGVGRALQAYAPEAWERIILRRGRGVLLLASLAALWRHLPRREWAAYLKAKLWPSEAFLAANRHLFASRRRYWRYLLSRSRDTA